MKNVGTCGFRVKIHPGYIHHHDTDGTGSTTLLRTLGSLGATDLIQAAFGRSRGRGHPFIFFLSNK